EDVDDDTRGPIPPGGAEASRRYSAGSPSRRRGWPSISPEDEPDLGDQLYRDDNAGRISASERLPPGSELSQNRLRGLHKPDYRALGGERETARPAQAEGGSGRGRRVSPGHERGRSISNTRSTTA